MDLLHRKDHGRPLRKAMKEADLSGPELAAATRLVDPEGIGVSPAVIGFLAGTGRSARERCKLRTAWLIAEGVKQPLQELFNMPTRSTSTEERSTPHGDEDPHRAG